jgi:hypothetical protein
VQAGILEDRPADSGVRSALMADPQLSERQKQVLMEIYESFRRENAATAEAAADPDTAADPAELIAGEPGAEAEALEAAMEAVAAMEAEAAAAQPKEPEQADPQPADPQPADPQMTDPQPADRQSVPPIRPNSASD